MLYFYLNKSLNKEKLKELLIKKYGMTHTPAITLFLNIAATRKPLLKHEAKGTAEVITKDRRLIERLFDNFKICAE
ncbi:hypothetical protein GCM10027516_27200 [Niabella aquatica]